MVKRRYIPVNKCKCNLKEISQSYHKIELTNTVLVIIIGHTGQDDDLRASDDLLYSERIL